MKTNFQTFLFFDENQKNHVKKRTSLFRKHLDHVHSYRMQYVQVGLHAVRVEDFEMQTLHFKMKNNAFLRYL